MTKLPEYTKTVPLSDGTFVTVQAWSLGDIAARSSEFMGMLEAFVARIKGQAELLPDADAMRLMERTVRFSLMRPEEAERIRACDLPALVTAVWEVNGLAELVGKFLHLRLQAHERQEQMLKTSEQGGTEP